MCKFNCFRYLCGAEKYVVRVPCEHVRTNVQGLQYCNLNPQAHVLDFESMDRDNVTYTYGPGICGNDNCRRHHYTANPDINVDDDEEFDMSPEACAEREDRWYRQCLTTDQQLELVGVERPDGAPWHKGLSAIALFWVFCEQVPMGQRLEGLEAASLHPQNIPWYDLNPRYMNARQLSIVTDWLLPQSVTDTRANSSSPRKPVIGPFKVGDHACKPKDFCRKCAKWNGEGPEPEKIWHKSYSVTPLGPLATPVSDRDREAQNTLLGPYIIKRLMPHPARWDYSFVENAKQAKEHNASWSQINWGSSPELLALAYAMDFPTVIDGDGSSDSVAPWVYYHPVSSREVYGWPPLPGSTQLAIEQPADVGSTFSDYEQMGTVADGEDVMMLDD